MKKIKKVIDKLLVDIEELELLYYQQGLDRFNEILKHDISVQDNSGEYEIPIDIFFAPCVDAYFYHVKKILQSDKTNEEKLATLRKIECHHDFTEEEIAELVDPNDVYENGTEYCFDFNLILLKNSMLKHALKLNNVVDEPDIKLKQLELIQYKKLINSEEFEVLYGKSKNTQLNYRQRRRHPLPYLGGGKGSDLMYDKEEVEKWFRTHL